jgi:putative transcriptional regulator
LAGRTGKLLVAHPRQTQSPFYRSVVLVTEDHDHGSVGLVLNKPTDFTLKQVMESKGYDCLADRMVYQGGPVNQSALVMIHSDTWYSSNTMTVKSTVASISSDNLMIEKLAMGDYPQNWRFVCGVSGWAPGQLEAEIRGTMGYDPSWLVCEANEDIIYKWDGEKQWHKALELCSSEMLAQYF